MDAYYFIKLPEILILSSELCHIDVANGSTKEMAITAAPKMVGNEQVSTRAVILFLLHYYGISALYYVIIA